MVPPIIESPSRFREAKGKERTCLPFLEFLQKQQILWFLLSCPPRIARLIRYQRPICNGLRTQLLCTNWLLKEPQSDDCCCGKESRNKKRTNSKPMKSAIFFSNERKKQLNLTTRAIPTSDVLKPIKADH